MMLLCCSTQLAAQQEEGRWVESINVLSPAPCSLVNGKLKVRLQAKEMTRLAAHTFVTDGKSARQVDLTPKGIIGSLHLLDVDYNKVSAYGHFTHGDMPWEQ